MKENHKKSFVLYFDMFAGIDHLAPAQRGELFSALFDYAQTAAEKPTEPDAILTRYPEMAPETRMAYRFMAETIRRDTEKWREKRERYVKAAKTRAEKSRDSDMRHYNEELQRKYLF